VKYKQGEIDLDKANTRFQEAFAKLRLVNRKDTKALFEQQARGVIRNVFAVTPPMGGSSASFKLPKPDKKARGGGVNFAQGKKQGQQAIDSGVNRVFRAVSPKKALQYQVSTALPDWAKDLLGTDGKAMKTALDYYKSKRNVRKRVPKIKIPASKTAMAYVRKEIYKLQGYVPAGWGQAVAKFAVTGIPGWIKRWFGSAKSRCTVINTEDWMGFEAVNGTSARYADQISRQIAIAINRQVGEMERWMKWNAEQAAKKILG
jgi:hypothetical protein